MKVEWKGNPGEQFKIPAHFTSSLLKTKSNRHWEKGKQVYDEILKDLGKNEKGLKLGLNRCCRHNIKHFTC